MNEEETVQEGEKEKKNMEEELSRRPMKCEETEQKGKEEVW